ncbi:hypothetical protein DFP74_6090 [Nocardiopsis sp. Huas11]|uniref:CdiA C-terminal domain-containing protein n=1 Tax=Nocardiopsis sp. Huas11 TaxID=2183912 RepID=UPI000EB1E3EB|nr:hypothetical protein [Nocardiopsis sp. Huas11]RKS10327.1 hypothetical protein DFP74_6090 [Nocardiopsis sp. Huas11]
MLILISPGAIPYPLTDCESLTEAAEALRSGGESLAGEAEDLKSTWQGLQAHYSAPESETLFTKMDPVTTRAEDLEADLATVASALENLAEAARTAQQTLDSLKREAWDFWFEHHGKTVWWFNKDDETDEFALLKNKRLQDEVNTAWQTFNEAEIACQNAIAAITGGPVAAPPDQAGPGEIAYGLPTDAGERDGSISFDTFNGFANDATDWAATEFHPSLAEFDSSTGQAIWDVVVTDALWGTAVGLTSKLGFWHADNGWRFDASGRWENTKAAWTDAWMDTVTLVGVHDGDGWLLSGGLDDRDWGATWDRWTTNLDASKDELWEGHTAWSRREDDPAYSDATIGTNIVMLTGGLPLKLLDTIAGAGGSPGRSTSSDGSFSDIDGLTPGSGWPSSPWPNTDRESTPTTERFGAEITELNESLLDPNRFRDTTGDSPDTPTYPSSPLPPRNDAPAPQGPTSSPDAESSPTHEAGSPPPRAGEEAAPRREDQDGQDTQRDRDEEGATPNRPRDDQDAPTTQDTPTPVTRPESDPQRGDSEAPHAEDNPTERPQGRDDDDTSASPNEARADGREGTREERGGPQEEQQSPDSATGGEGGGDQPPKDRTTTGDDDNGRHEDGDGENLPPSNQERLLDGFPNQVDTEGRVPRPEQTDPARYSESQVAVEDLRRDGLIDEGWESFEPKERRVAQFLSEQGVDVRSVTESTIDGRTTPDAVIAGTNSTIEFKILESGTPRAIEANIRKGRKQSSRIALDVRGPQIDSDVVMQSLGRTLKSNGGDLEELIIIGDGYVIVWP